MIFEINKKAAKSIVDGRSNEFLLVAVAEEAVSFGCLLIESILLGLLHLVPCYYDMCPWHCFSWSVLDEWILPLSKKKGNLSTKKLFFLLVFLLKHDGELLFHPSDLRCCASIIECEMSGVLKISNVSSRNAVLKRPSSDMRDQNSAKQQAMEGYRVQMLPGPKISASEYSAFRSFQSTKKDSGKNHVPASNQEHKLVGDASGVDAGKCSGGGDVAQMETQLKEMIPSSSGVVDIKYTVPDLNETAPDTESSGDVDKVNDKVDDKVDDKEDDKGPNFGNVSSSIGGFGQIVKIIRELEVKGHLKPDFRLKFLSWYGLRATEKEREVVCAFIRTINDDLSSLAGQLIDFFSYIMHRGS